MTATDVCLKPSRQDLCVILSQISSDLSIVVNGQLNFILSYQVSSSFFILDFKKLSVTMISELFSIQNVPDCTN